MSLGVQSTVTVRASLLHQRTVEGTVTPWEHEVTALSNGR